MNWSKGLLWSKELEEKHVLTSFSHFLTPSFPQKAESNSKTAQKWQPGKLNLGINLYLSSQKNWEKKCFQRPGNIGRILVRSKIEEGDQLILYMNLCRYWAHNYNAQDRPKSA